MWSLALVGLAGFVAGVQNALAGGGSFLTFPALLVAGLGPRAANITSTVALFPGQIASGLVNRRDCAGAGGVSLPMLIGISLAGGAVGAWLLLATPERVFSRLVPWLVLFATATFAWNTFVRRPTGARHLGRRGTMAAQCAIAVYGGYFGGGIGILMLAALTMGGLAVRAAGATKNVLAAVMNASAVVVFLFSSHVGWAQAIVLGLAAIAGGQIGAHALRRLNERILRIAITAIGLALSIGLFLRAA